MSCILRISAENHSLQEAIGCGILAPYRVEQTDEGRIHAYFEMSADGIDTPDDMDRLVSRVQQNIAQVGNVTKVPGTRAELDIMVGLEEPSVMKSVRLPADLIASLGAIGVDIVVSIYKVSD